jgi:hypothetical protein
MFYFASLVIRCDVCRLWLSMSDSGGSVLSRPARDSMGGGKQRVIYMPWEL